MSTLQRLENLLRTNGVPPTRKIIRDLKEMLRLGVRVGGNTPYTLHVNIWHYVNALLGWIGLHKLVMEYEGGYDFRRWDKHYIVKIPRLLKPIFCPGDGCRNTRPTQYTNLIPIQYTGQDYYGDDVKKYLFYRRKNRINTSIQKHHCGACVSRYWNKRFGISSSTIDGGGVDSSGSSMDTKKRLVVSIPDRKGVDSSGSSMDTKKRLVVSIPDRKGVDSSGSSMDTKAKPVVSIPDRKGVDSSGSSLFVSSMDTKKRPVVSIPSLVEYFKKNEEKPDLKRFFLYYFHGAKKPHLFLNWSKNRRERWNDYTGTEPASFFYRYHNIATRNSKPQNPIHLASYLFKRMVKEIGGGEIPKFEKHLADEVKLTYCVWHLRKYFPGIAQCADLQRWIKDGDSICNIAARLWMRV
jgi:hypothetical protein